MRPPEFITRLPRKIELTRKYWKGICLNYLTPLSILLTFPMMCFLYDYLIFFSFGDEKLASVLWSSLS